MKKTNNSNDIKWRSKAEKTIIENVAERLDLDICHVYDIYIITYKTLYDVLRNPFYRKVNVPKLGIFKFKKRKINRLISRYDRLKLYFIKNNTNNKFKTFLNDNILYYIKQIK